MIWEFLHVLLGFYITGCTVVVTVDIFKDVWKGIRGDND
jgi:hypothetical protein